MYEQPYDSRLENLAEDVGFLAAYILPEYSRGEYPPLLQIANAKLIAMGGEALVLDPVESGSLGELEQMDQVFDGLLERAPAGQVVPRWQSTENTQATVGSVIEQCADAINKLACRFGMIRRGTHEDTSRIVANSAVFAVEGGANKTSAVRRGVAENAAHEIYGGDLSGVTLYQFGSSREIPVLRTDSKTGEQKPNSEHAVIRALAPELPEDRSFTEFEANIATARADGYEVVQDSEHSDSNLPEGVAQIVELRHASDPTRPTILAVCPTGRRLVDGLSGLAKMIDLNGKQLVIATNGQYRPKDEHIVDMWIRDEVESDSNSQMHPTVAIGDEPGDIFNHNGTEIVVPNRSTAVYVAEIAVLGRQLLKEAKAEL